MTPRENKAAVNQQIASIGQDMKNGMSTRDILVRLSTERKSIQLDAKIANMAERLGETSAVQNAHQNIIANLREDLSRVASKKPDVILEGKYQEILNDANTQRESQKKLTDIIKSLKSNIQTFAQTVTASGSKSNEITVMLEKLKTEAAEARKQITALQSSQKQLDAKLGNKQGGMIRSVEQAVLDAGLEIRKQKEVPYTHQNMPS
jgi:SMC interacting uncharacterized protein involved in chromosome segregation